MKYILKTKKARLELSISELETEYKRAIKAEKTNSFHDNHREGRVYLEKNKQQLRKNCY